MKLRKKGFTIVEIVIALAVIAIVSLAATSIVLTSQSVQKKTRDKFFAVSFCNNSLSIFQSAAAMSADINSDESDNADSQNTHLSNMYSLFSDGMSKLLNVTMPNIEEDSIDHDTITIDSIYFDGDWKQTNQEDEKFTCYMSFKEDNGLTFTIRIYNNDNELYSLSYSMPLGGTL